MLRHIQADPGLKRQERADMASALRTFAKILNQQPEVMPAVPAVYRPRLKNLTPAVTGLSAKRIANMKSLLLKAFARYGTIRRHRFGPLTPAWRTVGDRLSVPQRCALSRFMSWASAAGTSPAEVDDETMGRFRVALIHESLIKDPSARLANTCRMWLHIREQWPDLRLGPVSILRLRRTYVLKAEEFPASFQQELAAFCARLAGTDVFADDAAARA
jgi:hypothetical protein